MKTKKPTKKEILTTLKSLDCEKIISIASRCGIDVNDFNALHKFVQLTPNLSLFQRYFINNMLYNHIIGDGNYRAYAIDNIKELADNNACISE